MARSVLAPRTTRIGVHGDAKVLAAGGVLWRGDPAGPGTEREIAVVHRPKYDDWSLHKGKVDPGEQLVVTARREVCEETGSTADCGQVVGEQRYRVAAGQKYVRYWAMAARGGEFSPHAEIDDLLWLPSRQALRVLSYVHDRQLVQRFSDSAVATATVLLVRHAKAGQKRRWKGDDGLRPLEKEGQAQAQRLAAVAPCYGPTCIASADIVRCTQTVGPVSEKLELPVETESLLGRDSYADDPDKTVAWLRERIEAGGTTLLCSQGEVIPDLIGRLAARSKMRLRRPAARKGSLWALSFVGQELVGADYDADLLPAVVG